MIREGLDGTVGRITPNASATRSPQNAGPASAPERRSAKPAANVNRGFDPVSVI
jgi:hypothetical protein